jgi:hypothetical protein
LRAYSTAVVAAALGISRRWLDTVVAANRIPGVEPARQGRSRAISPRAIVTIAVALELIESLAIPMMAALDLATRLIVHGEHRASPRISIHLDVAAIERRVASRLGDAVESNPPTRRGRPPRRHRPNAGRPDHNGA